MIWPIQLETHHRTPYMMRKRSTIAVAGLVLAVSGACSAGQAERSSAPGSQDGTEVAVVNIAYEPDPVEVSVGDTVTWTSEDQGVRHTVTSGDPAGETVPGVSEGEASKPDGVFDGALDDAGATFSFTFEKSGTFAYFCEVHPSMTGEVVVR